MIHTSLTNQIVIYCFVVILFTPDLAHFELHHVTSKCSSFVRKDIANLAEFFINCAGVHFAALTVEHFILVILNHLDVNFHKICLRSLSYFDSYVERYRYEGVIEAKSSQGVEDDFDRASLVAQYWNLKIEVRVTVLYIPTPIRKTQKYAHNNYEIDYLDYGLIRILIKTTLFVS